MKLETEYAETKYDKKSLKAINTEIDKVEHPELYVTNADDKYINYIQPIVEKSNKGANKYPEYITVLDISTEQGFFDAEKYLHEQAGTGKLFAAVILFQLPASAINHVE